MKIVKHTSFYIAKVWQDFKSFISYFYFIICHFLIGKIRLKLKNEKYDSIDIN